jgi:ribosomal protein S11
MQIQKKELKYKFKKKRTQAFKRIKAKLRNSINFTNLRYQLFNRLNSKNKIIFQLNIRLTPNNVFCTLKNLKTKKIVLFCSSGKYKLKVSKKNLKFINKIIIQKFLAEIEQKIQFKLLIVNIIAPIKIRKSIIKQLNPLIKTTKLIIQIKEVKIFNGCRPPKKRRKKQKGLRILK